MKWLRRTFVYERNPWCSLRFYVNAVRYERARIIAWRKRYDPETSRRYGTLAAWRSVIENPPSFDGLWDEQFEADEEIRKVLEP
jgi:hypothetical protein